MQLTPVVYIFDGVIVVTFLKGVLYVVMKTL